MTHTETPIAAETRTYRRTGTSDPGQLVRDARRGLILVIDDDEGIRSALVELLEMYGYGAVAAADGQEAVEMLEVGLEPSAIVLDLMMPGMDGWTFLARLRGDERFEGVPVVVTSAVTCPLPQGADAYLQKPFDVRQLDREVARLTAH